MRKYPAITQIELLNAIYRSHVKIQERLANGHRGLTTLNDDGESYTIQIAWRPHKASDHGVDMVNTLLHETLHTLRWGASESWVRRWAGTFTVDHAVRAAAAVRLLNATYFDD